MLFKFPSYMSSFAPKIQTIILQLMDWSVRMESIGLALGSAYFEKLGVSDSQFCRKFFISIFTILNSYRNKTKSNQIPVPITKSCHTFFGTFMVNAGVQQLVTECDNIQQGILLMVLTSEGDKIKYVGGGQPRDKKYVIVGYTQLIASLVGSVDASLIAMLVSSLIELCGKSLPQGSGFGSFAPASLLNATDTEELLIDGAFD